MKKYIFIISGIVIALLIIASWGYLFIYGAPENATDIFANFRGGDEPRAPAETLREGVVVDTRSSDDVTLRQLTTKPVAGAAFADENSVVYAERGTGYVYSIDTLSGRETPVSGTTHTKVVDAEFSPQGNAVVFTIETQNGLLTSIELFVKDNNGEPGLLNIATSYNIDNATFSEDGGTLLYTHATENGVQVNSYDIENRTDSFLSALPFSEAVISWGDPVYVSVKPTASLMGYVYGIADSSLRYLRGGGFGLTAFGYNGGFVTTEVTDDGISSLAFEDRIYQLPLPLFPEKCAEVPPAESILVCGAPFTLPDNMEYPDDWYKGAVALEDSLWGIDIHRGEAALLADPLTQTGRAIDVAKIVSNADGTRFLLINKNDHTLWLFEPSF